MDEQSIVVGGGCFWCIEAVYRSLNGVLSAVSGYAGGNVENPDYEAVCSGNTGHAEVVEVRFDKDVLSLRVVLEVFFSIHDPTTLNRQGGDVGSQYRSVIFYRDKAQKELAEQLIEEIDASQQWPSPVVTQVLPAPSFYLAEDYHQNYFEQHTNQGYCQVVISPKLSKFRTRYKTLLRS